MTDILSHLGLKRGQLNDAFMIEKPHWPEIKEQILLPMQATSHFGPI